MAGWCWEVAPLKGMHQPGAVASAPLISMDIETDGYQIGDIKELMGRN